MKNHITQREEEMAKSDLFHIINWFRIGKNASWKLSFMSLQTLLYFFKPFKTERRFNVVQQKHKFVLSYLNEIYKDDIAEYTDNATELSAPSNKDIWVFWNTGEDSMPPIVKLCQASLKKHANGAKIHLLTMANLNEFIEIPPHIMEKYENGIMTLAFLTDYIRICLLEKYGGLWLDATILATQDIPDRVFNQPLYSLHTKYEKTIFVNDNKIHCYVLGGMKGYSFFTYIRQELEEYWKDHDFMIDYYLLDYTIMHAYLHNKTIRKRIDNLEYTPSSLYDIIAIINEPASKTKLLPLEKENIFSKLNWRVIPKNSCKGEDTVFSQLSKEMANRIDLQQS